MDDESGESMELMEEVPLEELGEADSFTTAAAEFPHFPVPTSCTEVRNIDPGQMLICLLVLSQAYLPTVTLHRL